MLACMTCEMLYDVEKKFQPLIAHIYGVNMQMVQK